jgi:hypothetical protein
MNGYTITLIFLMAIGVFLGGMYVGHKVGMNQTVPAVRSVTLVQVPAKIESVKVAGKIQYFPAKVETVKSDTGSVQIITQCPEFVARMDTIQGRDSIHVEYWHKQPQPFFNLSWNRSNLPPETVQVAKPIGLWIKGTLSGYNESSAQIELGYSMVGGGIQWIRRAPPNYTISFTQKLFR